MKVAPLCYICLYSCPWSGYQSPGRY